LLRVLYSSSADPHGKQKTAPLTTRELEIIITIASKHTNKDVAQRFSISDNTVNTISRISLTNWMSRTSWNSRSWLSAEV